MILDVRDKTSPKRLGQCSQSPWSNSREVCILNNRAFASGYGRLTVDISDKTHPHVVSLYGDMTIWGLFVDSGNSILYETGTYAQYNTLTASRIENEDQLTELWAMYPSVGVVTGVFEKNGRLYVAGNAGVAIIDSTSHEILGSFPCAAVNVCVDGNYAYVAGAETDIIVLDVSNPSNPTLLDSQDTGGLGCGIKIVGNYIYLADKDSLRIYQFSSGGTAPTVTITQPTSDPTYSTSSSTINISGTATDDTGVTRVTWANNATGSSGDCTLSGTSWSKSGISLNSGQNIITVTAYDAAGNTGTDTLTVTYTTTTGATILGMGFDLLRVYQDEQMNIYVTNKNTGTTSKTFTIRGTAGGVNSSTATVTMAPNETKACTLTWTPTASVAQGLYEFKAEILEQGGSAVLDSKTATVGVEERVQITGFTFENIPSSVDEDRPFTFTVEAVSSGNLVSSFSDDVLLSLDMPSIYLKENRAWKVDRDIRSIRLTNGQGSCTAYISIPGKFRIRADYKNKCFGESSKINVGTKANRKVRLAIDPSFGTPINFYLDRGTADQQDKTVTLGNYWDFRNVSAGIHTAEAETTNNGITYKSGAISITVGAEPFIDIFVLKVNPPASQNHPPVLLLPGILGSTLKGDLSTFCNMPPGKAMASSLEVLRTFDFLPADVFTDLRQAIAAQGCPVLEAPYDWRLPLNDIWREYLIPYIDQATNAYGGNKVDIVAHSLGGMVALGYILSDEYRNDIRRFVLLGAPCTGSFLGTHIIPTGDVNAWGSFYRMAVDNLLEVHYPGMNFVNEAWEVRRVIREHAPSVYDASRWHANVTATFSDGMTIDAAALYRNRYVENIMTSVNKAKMTNSILDASKIATMICYTTNLDTMTHLVIKTSSLLQEVDEGIDSAANWTAVGKVPDDYESKVGDGTHTVADYTVEWDPSETYMKRSPYTGISHAELACQHDVNTNVLTWLGLDPSYAFRPKRAKTPATQKLVVSTFGPAQPYLTDPSDQGSGAIGDDVATNIPNSIAVLMAEGGTVTINSPANGNYGGVIRPWSRESLIILKLSYIAVAATNVTIERVKAICHTNDIEFDFTLNSLATNPITIHDPVSPPTELRSFNSAGKTRLRWKASADANVAGYNVYVASYDQANYSLWTNVNASTMNYVSDIPYNSSGSDTGRYYFAVLAYNTAGEESFIHETVENYSTSVLQITADYDGDGKTDPAVLQLDSGTITALLSASGYSSTSVTFNVQGIFPVSGDFDGDGKSDFAVYYRGGTWYGQLSGSGSSVSAPFGTFNTIPVPADYDGDGKTDPAYYHEASGLWAVAFSGSDYAMVSGLIGGNGYTPVVADYDGDGKADPAVYQDATGTWIVMRSSYQYAQVSLTGFGGNGYVPVVADYDGDGKADLGIYKTSSGLLTVLLSGSGYQSLLQTMSTGALPVIGDFDGDGKTDFATYQEATGQWNVMFSASSNAVTHATFGGPGLVPVQ